MKLFGIFASCVLNHDIQQQSLSVLSHRRNLVSITTKETTFDSKNDDYFNWFTHHSSRQQRINVVLFSENPTELTRIIENALLRYPVQKALSLVISMTNKPFCLFVTDQQRIFAGKRGGFPLVLGRIQGQYIICSETACLRIHNGSYVRDILGNELIIIDDENNVESIHHEQTHQEKLNPFELAWYIRPDSQLTTSNDGIISVSSIRKQLGVQLAKEENKANIDPLYADSITAIPGVSEFQAFGYASMIDVMNDKKSCKIGYDMVFMPNLGTNTTTILSGIVDKTIVLVLDRFDDTLKTWIKLLRDRCVGKIHLRIASPRTSSPNHHIGKRGIHVDSIRFLSKTGFQKIISSFDPMGKT